MLRTPPLLPVDVHTIERQAPSAAPIRLGSAVIVRGQPRDRATDVMRDGMHCQFGMSASAMAMRWRAPSP